MSNTANEHIVTNEDYVQGIHEIVEKDVMSMITGGGSGASIIKLRPPSPPRPASPPPVVQGPLRMPVTTELGVTITPQKHSELLRFSDYASGKGFHVRDADVNIKGKIHLNGTYNP